ncbi:MAG: hypothetical protein R3Y50_05195 [Rikenellaceae bacterium]
MFELFVKGDVLCMTIITLELVALLLAAYKAPQWVRNIGTIALCTGLLSTTFGMYKAFGMLHMAPDVSPALIYGALQVTLIPIIYGMLIYVASIVIKIVQTPRM